MTEPTLPDCLTRLLAAQPPRLHGHSLEPEQRPPEPAGRRPAHAALESALLRGFVYGVSGLVWLFVAVLILHHVAR